MLKHKPSADPESPETVAPLGAQAFFSRVTPEQGIFFSIGLDGQFLEVSRGSQQLWGFQPEELIGLNFLDFIHPEDRLRVRELTEAADGARPADASPEHDSLA